jgi:hypothetical protein
MTYGQEVPFSEGTCGQNTVCAIAAAQSVTVTNTYEINGSVQNAKRGKQKQDDEEGKELMARGDWTPSEIAGAFNLGASYSWSKSVTYGTTQTKTKTLGDNQCGYWTFIPFMMG